MTKRHSDLFGYERHKEDDKKSTIEILIVDDDKEVHSITRFALLDYTFRGSSGASFTHMLYKECV